MPLQLKNVNVHLLVHVREQPTVILVCVIVFCVDQDASFGFFLHVLENLRLSGMRIIDPGHIALPHLCKTLLLQRLPQISAPFMDCLPVRQELLISDWIELFHNP